MFGQMKDWDVEPVTRELELKDYAGAAPRWCPGCGDHTVLTIVQRLARDLQLQTERTVVVSGIGCSSRFPHYMSTYGFHGLHGRALPVACGVRARRPDLDVFVVTGDGDCCAIGTAHWIHALRYNMNLTILLLDNNIYGLTKSQTSPTTKKGEKSNTHPQGSYLPPLNPISVSLGIANASFVAQTVDWNQAHLYETIKAAHAHKGASFVRVLQRCPHFTSHVFQSPLRHFEELLLMSHPDGVMLDEAALKKFPNRIDHDPTDLAEGRALADRADVYPIGVFYRNPEAECYDDYSSRGVTMSRDMKLAAMNKALDRFLV